ncbi:reverse transcriptase domain-containing protein [Gemmiger sp. An194]|uniref:reverse transcriptase domain-containing protein n=1 Tax=Gemmiger sp. An194 TaxID=1965582 RepID=UPI000B39DDEC|nr:reverse transcriptase domain-containing protein [Gemmiger sp. An194]OUP23512.1 group II intron reverse transcriptase/maturase [Gemmiger sp. An194]
MRNPKNVLESLTSKAANEDYHYKRLYRNLYNPEFFLLAYERTQAKPGNMTAGNDGNTIDGMSMKRIDSLIQKLKDFSYQPKPARRTYIPKANGKMRPLGIPAFDDKLVQEVVRMILESIYEPTFQNSSHGFRPKRSCHTALQYIKRNYTGVKWFVEGDIKGCFDNVDHHVLVRILRRRIKDEYFISLIWKFLKAGYMEDWVYHNTYSGTPQGSLISPILANIYLNELDVFMAKYAESFNCGKGRKINPAYKMPLDVRRGKQEWLKRNSAKISEEKRQKVMAEIRELNNYLSTVPYSDPMDTGYKRVVYVRYADDFLIGVIGSKEDAKQVKTDVGEFIKEQLHLEMSPEKTLITHGNDFARFLGYLVTVSREQNRTRTKNGFTRRTYVGKVKLYVPKEKWLNRLLSYGALKISYDKAHGNKEVWEPVRRPGLIRLDDIEILNQYNAEVRGMYNYYRLANNATVLNAFVYVMKYSMYKTFAGKYRTSMRKIIRKYCRNKDFTVSYQTKSGTKSVVFYNQGMRHNDKVVVTENPDIIGRANENRRYTRLTDRLQGHICEFCGAETEDIEIHHIRKLKDLSGKAEWERQMIARKRKTMALCHSCHVKLHNGKLD